MRSTSKLFLLITNNINQVLSNINASTHAAKPNTVHILYRRWHLSSIHYSCVMKFVSISCSCIIYNRKFWISRSLAKVRIEMSHRIRHSRYRSIFPSGTDYFSKGTIILSNKVFQPKFIKRIPPFSKLRRIHKPVLPFFRINNMLFIRGVFCDNPEWNRNHFRLHGINSPCQVVRIFPKFSKFPVSRK